MHIVFQADGAVALRKSFDLDESLRGEIFIVRDDYSVGPLLCDRLQEQLKWRQEWWQRISGEEYSLQDEEGINDLLLIHRIKKHLDAHPAEKITLWVAPNSVDVSGYYHLLFHLLPFQGKVQVIHLNNLPFINEKGGLFFPKSLGEIPAREFVKAKKLAREIPAHEFELDMDEWKQICAGDGLIRKHSGAKKLSVCKKEVYDKDLLSVLSKNFSKGSRVLQHFYAKFGVIISDLFLLRRFKEMEETGQVEVRPEGGRLKDLEVRNAFVEAATEDKS